MNLGDLHNVWEIKALKKPGEEEARKILEKIAKQVQPIMRKRKWRVKLLSEFCPKNPSLLGLNVGGGVHVKLRLRRPNRDWDFYPFDQILDTMLHELCHNVHGPHNASFYQLWDELRKECEQLMSKGVTGTGEGFDLPGRRLGGFSRQTPLSSLHKTALAAAEKRARLGCLLSSGPNRLGGDSVIMAALSPIQAAAMAAERRLQDDIWCASHSEVSGDIDTLEDPVYTEQNSLSSRDHGGGHEHAVEEKTQKRSHGSDTDSSFHYSNNQLEPNFVDLTRSASSSMSLLDHGTRSPKRSCKSNNFAPSQSRCPSESSVIDSFSVSSSSNLDARHSSEESSMWECGSCTLLNPPLAPICELCNTIRPKDAAAKYKFWSCKFCTLENSAKLDKCSACGQWRYSYGPPVSMPAPNLGT